MKIEDIRADFKIVYIDDEYRRSTELCEAMAEVGYQTQYYPTLDSGMLAVRSTSPHILVLHFSKNESASEKFLTLLRKSSPETQVILLIDESHLIGSIMKTSVGEIFDYLVVPYISSSELLHRLDRSVEQLYLKFENEQLRKRRGIGPIVGSALEGFSFDESDSGVSLQKLQTHFAELSSIKDQEELIKKYIFQVSSFCGSMPVVYLRFLPNQMSFVYTQSIWSPVTEVKNLGFRIESLDSQSLVQIGSNPTGVRAISEFMNTVFQIDEFSCLLHFDNHQLQGLSIILNKTLTEEQVPVRLCHEFFESVYGRNELIKVLHTQQTQDVFTGLLNKKTFEEKLKDEVSRARRIQHPLSVMKLQIDHFDLLSQKYGEENMMMVVKALARSMKKNFRTIDILARVAQSEFCFLLPHTEIKNTLVKAEKVRRAFESSQFPFVQIEDKSKFSLSIGVSEYPSLCSDAEGLIKSCDEALYQVKRNQGNRVAAWQIDEDFTPDFLSQPTRNLG